jgi:hypothetical protein
VSQTALRLRHIQVISRSLHDYKKVTRFYFRHKIGATVTRTIPKISTGLLLRKAGSSIYDAHSKMFYADNKNVGLVTEAVKIEFIFKPRHQSAIQRYRLLTNPSKMWQSLNNLFRRERVTNQNFIPD